MLASRPSFDSRIKMTLFMSFSPLRNNNSECVIMYKGSCANFELQCIRRVVSYYTWTEINEIYYSPW